MGEAAARAPTSKYASTRSNCKRSFEFEIMKMKLRPEVEQFLHQMVSYVRVNGERWYYMPYWLKKVGDEFEIVSFEDLPDYVKEAIQKVRDDPRTISYQYQHPDTSPDTKPE
jgi:hypothetical protein